MAADPKPSQRTPVTRPEGALSAREGSANPDQGPSDPDATLPKDSPDGGGERHADVSDATLGDPEKGPRDQPVSVARQTSTAWWCPVCDNSQTHDFDRCAKCGTPKPKALRA